MPITVRYTIKNYIKGENNLHLKIISTKNRYLSLDWYKKQILKLVNILSVKGDTNLSDRNSILQRKASSLFHSTYSPIIFLCKNPFTAYQMMDELFRNYGSSISESEDVISRTLEMIITQAQLENKLHISNAAKLVLNKMGLDNVAEEIRKEQIKSINPKAYHLITTNLEKMIIDIKNSFHAERIDSFHYYGPDIIVRRDGFNVLISLPLAMIVNNGEWHGGEEYIQTKVIFSEDKIQIFRKMTEVIPKTSEFDPITPNYTHLLNRSVIINVEPFDTLEERFVSALEPVFHENLTAQSDNAIINNCDASSD